MRDILREFFLGQPYPFLGGFWVEILSSRITHGLVDNANMMVYMSVLMTGDKLFHSGGSSFLVLLVMFPINCVRSGSKSDSPLKVKRKKS